MPSIFLLSTRIILASFWWKNNDTNEELVEYRAKVHVFGNRSSPASANVGLRYAASISSCSKEVIKFVHHNFYVDDGCGCSDTAEEAIALLGQTCEALGKCNIRLHKISSSSTKVLEAFPASERSRTSPLDTWPESSQPTLGIEWNTATDMFVIRTCVPDRPFTKRGVLATLNSTFDPL